MEARTGCVRDLLHSRKSDRLAQSLGPQPQFNVAVRANGRAAGRRLPETSSTGLATSSPLWGPEALSSAQLSLGCTGAVSAVARSCCWIAGSFRDHPLIEFWITNGTGGVT